MLRAALDVRSASAAAYLAQGRAGLRGDARRAAADAPTTEMPNRLGLARWLVEPEPAHRARRGQPRLGAVLRPRHRRDQRGLRHAGRAAVASRSCSTGWPPSSCTEVEPEGAAPADRDVGDLPAGRRRRRPRWWRRDPYNRLLARGPRFRLEAEMVRDAVLAASGLLSREDRRPERLPAAARRHLGHSRTATRSGSPSEGEDRYRRGLYTFIRRTSPYPSFMTFDATSRELCTVRRVRTNTPLQALTHAERRGVLRGGARARRARAAGRHRRRRAQPAQRTRSGDLRVPALHVANADDRRDRSHRRVVRAAARRITATTPRRPRETIKGAAVDGRRRRRNRRRGRSSRTRC